MYFISYPECNTLWKLKLGEVYTYSNFWDDVLCIYSRYFLHVQQAVKRNPHFLSPLLAWLLAHDILWGILLCCPFMTYPVERNVKYTTVILSLNKRTYLQINNWHIFFPAGSCHYWCQVQLRWFAPDMRFNPADYCCIHIRYVFYAFSAGCNKWTIQDIWRLAWQKNSHRIVMVTNLVEGGKVTTHAWSRRVQFSISGH